MNRQPRAWFYFSRVTSILTLFVICFIVFSASTVLFGDALSQVRRLTGTKEFDYVDWTFEALASKALSAALSPQKYLPAKDESDIVRQYLKMVEQEFSFNSEVEIIYADPSITDPLQSSEQLRQELALLQAELDQLSPIVEAILQGQVTNILAGMGFGITGEIFPPPLYQVTELPLALVISPRDKINRIADISLQAGMSTAEKDTLESEILSSLDYSALVVPVGGIGAYPTMVMQTTDLVWLAETIAHEWTHNYLTLRPLGFNYASSPELRTINETTASIAGREIGLALITEYFPDLVPSPPIPNPRASTGETIQEPPRFDFRAEMKITRDQVDTLLSQGDISEAEAYMEQRRQVFWQNGYLIRKLNQAYFAFYGAYNDIPGGGASGSDPIGPAVTSLREESDSLYDFIKTISSVTSSSELFALVDTP